MWQATCVAKYASTIYSATWQATCVAKYASTIHSATWQATYIGRITVHYYSLVYLLNIVEILCTTLVNVHYIKLIYYNSNISK